MPAACRLSEVEVTSALSRLAHDGVISSAERDRGLEKLTDDLETFWIVELASPVVDLARLLLTRHSLRAADAIQLASCLHLRREVSESIPLVAYDERLRKVALAEDVQVIPAAPARPRRKRSG